MKFTELLGEKDRFYQKAGFWIFVLFSIFLLIRAFLGEMIYGEIDSNALPIISMQYRGSFLMNETDLVRAQVDFPQLYAGISTYDDLRLNKLIQTPNGWMSCYFPAYPLVCLPIKLLFTFCRVPQDRSFCVTNALLVSFALWVVYKKLNATPKQRFIALVFLILSPIYYYILFICYEAFMFSMLTISLVQYYNKKYKSSAVALALAGMSNSTIMAVGLVMIFYYFVQLLDENRGKSLFATAKSNLIPTVQYGCCFLPCLAPFLLQWYAYDGSPFSELASGEYLTDRFLSYLFDPSLGLFTFAPVELVLFFGVVVIAVFRKRTDALPWLFFLLGTIGAFSFMTHINCGMWFCARYLVWTYPIIALFLATVGYTVLRSIRWKGILYFTAAASSALLLYVNHSTAYLPFNFNPVTQMILEKAPALYHPYSATFYCRTLHEDGAYGHTEPAYYTDKQTGVVRKLIFKADPGQAEIVQKELTGDGASVAYLQKRLSKISEDGKFHYVDFPERGQYQLRQKTPEEAGTLQRGLLLNEAEDVQLIWDGNCNVYQLPITIHENTVYQIELVLSEDFDFGASSMFFVDFCAENYDFGQQEQDDFLINGRYAYTIYFDSGAFGTETKEVVARICNLTKQTDGLGSRIKRFAVTEMTAGD